MTSFPLTAFRMPILLAAASIGALVILSHFVKNFNSIGLHIVRQLVIVVIVIVAAVLILVIVILVLIVLIFTI
jgi:hypothetical protein